MMTDEKWAEIIEEHARLMQFHDNIEQLYHRSIDEHKDSVSIHTIGDFLLIAGSRKEVQIIR